MAVDSRKLGVACAESGAWAAQVRYAAVRRQTAAHAGEREVQVLDNQNTAADLLPLLASAYALLFMVWAGSSLSPATGCLMASNCSVSRLTSTAAVCCGSWISQLQLSAA